MYIIQETRLLRSSTNTHWPISQRQILIVETDMKNFARVTLNGSGKSMSLVKIKNYII